MNPLIKMDLCKEVLFGNITSGHNKQNGRNNKPGNGRDKGRLEFLQEK